PRKYSLPTRIRRLRSTNPNAMQVSSFFSTKHLRNTYVVHKSGAKNAVLVDPSEIEVSLFTLLERHNLVVESVLLTHADENYAGALKSLQKIYGELQIYGGADACAGVSMTNVKESEFFKASGLRIHPIFIPGHFSDALMYRIGGMLFSGALVGAGSIEKADESYGRALVVQCVEETFRSLPETMIVLPSQGPPTSVATELATNYDIHHQ